MNRVSVDGSELNSQASAVTEIMKVDDQSSALEIESSNKGGNTNLLSATNGSNNLIESGF